MANNKKGKAFKNLYKNPVSINSIIPGGGRHGARLAKKLWKILNIKLGLVILCNFALGRAAPYWGAFAYITGIISQIIKNIASGQIKLAALLKGFNRELKGESLQIPQPNLREDIRIP